MPKIDEDAKAWQKDLSGRVGRAVQTRRRELKMSASTLAKRCAALGYPISRVAIGKIETNHREGKFDLAEWLILATALNIPPALLVFPGYPDDKIEELLPGLGTASHEAAADWLSGRRPLPPEITDDGVVHIRRGNPGGELVLAVDARKDLQRRSFPLLGIDPNRPDLDENTRQTIKQYREQAATINQTIDEYKAQLWGSREGRSDG